MGERVSISYRGAAYELGRGKSSYGIWQVGVPRTEPVERWPETPEGWNAAWTRFAGIETPGSIVAAKPGMTLGITASKGSGVATGLLAIGVLFGVIGLFPGYLAGQSLASQPALLVPHVIYLAAWTLSAGLILFGGVRRRAGALLGAGTSIITFGLFFTDIGTVIAGGSRLMDAGLWLSLIGWIACAAGSALACLIKADGVKGTDAKGTDGATASTAASIGFPGMPRGYEIARAGLLILAGIGAAVAFAPSWDSYLIHLNNGTTVWQIAGNAFSNPGWVIAGNLATMIAFGLVLVAAALWRPVKLGAALLAGATIPMAAQAISALIQVTRPTPPAQLGISSQQASQLGVTIINGVTPAFWIFSILMVALLVSCAWMLITPSVPLAATTTAPGAPPSPWTAPQTAPKLETAPSVEAEEEEDDDIDWDDEDESAATTEAMDATTKPNPTESAT
jgi:hypothetical protein